MLDSSIWGRFIWRNRGFVAYLSWSSIFIIVVLGGGKWWKEGGICSQPQASLLQPTSGNLEVGASFHILEFITCIRYM